MAPSKASMLAFLSLSGVLSASGVHAQTREEWRAAQGQTAEQPKLVLAQSYHGTRPGEGNALPRVEEIKGKEGNWVTWPGFLMRPDSGSRVFIQTTKALAYEKTVKKKTVRLEFKDTKVFLNNNRNPLVTVNFNTPLKTAYLERHKKSVELVMTLKVESDVVITQATDADGYCYLFVDFPVGTFDTGGDWHPRVSSQSEGSSGSTGASTFGSWEPSPKSPTTSPDTTPAAGDASPPSSDTQAPAPPLAAPAPDPDVPAVDSKEEPPAQDPESEIYTES